MTFQINSKVLVIGLDGATFDIIGPMIAEGKLPNLEKMIMSGVHSKLYSTILPLSPTAWTSFSSGKNAGKHGIYDFSKRIEGKYDYVPTLSLDNKTRCLWDIIGRLGGRSIVVNVPLTYPPKKINGFMISGFPTPTEKNDYTYPSELLIALKEKFGDIHIHKPKVLYRKGREEEITDELIEITRQQTEITRYLMEQSEWNFAISVYDATDVIGHYFWAYLDKNHPKYDAKLSQSVRQMVEEIHVELDHSIGRLNEAAGQDALKIVLSDHGFGSVYYGVYVNNWLLEQDYMYFKDSIRTKAKYWAFKHGLNTYNLLQLAKKIGIVKSIESAYATKSFLLSLLKKTSLSFEDVDWNRTRVYSAGNFGQLYINMKGREPSGIVPPQDAEQLIKELKSKLQELRDPETGRRMFDHIYSREEVFSGGAAADGPDIVFFDEEMVYAAHRMFELGSNKLVTLHPVYSGNHKMDGILFMAGPGVKFIPGLPRSQPRLVDLAPTILHYMGSNVPEDMDGRILQEFFEPSSEFSQRPVEYTLGEDGEASKIRGSLQRISLARSL